MNQLQFCSFTWPYKTCFFVKKIILFTNLSLSFHNCRTFYTVVSDTWILHKIIFTSTMLTIRWLIRTDQSQLYQTIWSALVWIWILFLKLTFWFFYIYLYYISFFLQNNGDKVVIILSRNLWTHYTKLNYLPHRQSQSGVSICLRNFYNRKYWFTFKKLWCRHVCFLRHPVYLTSTKLKTEIAKQNFFLREGERETESSLVFIEFILHFANALYIPIIPHGK